MTYVVHLDIALQATTLTFSLTCPFGQLTKKSPCPTQFFSFPKKYLNKNFQNQRAITSNLCKMFPLLSHKHYLISSLLIDIMIMTSSIKKKHISLRHKVIGIKRCHHGISV